MAKASQTAAKVNKNDEFYTRIEDISNELMHYKDHFKDKVVYCNCDDATWSNFWRYFHLSFKHLGLKKLISTGYNPGGTAYKAEYAGGNDNDISVCVKTDFTGDGDFRSEESIECLKEADIVVTNPPFSLFREYIAQLLEYDKKFLIIAKQDVITYKDVFPLFKNGKMWPGFTFNRTMEFIMPDSYEIKGKGFVDSNGKKHGFVPGICWFTNLDIYKRHETLDLFKKYTPEEYPKYDNYDAINVDRVAYIPKDYDGIMGVPITFLDKYNPEQFELIGCSLFLAKPIKDCVPVTDTYSKGGPAFYVPDGANNHKRLYYRIAIRRNPNFIDE